MGAQDALLAQMRRGTLQYCVLALLAEEERYAFDLVRALANVEGMVTSEGTIYPLLTRLRRDGLVDSWWRESTAGPPRRYYRLTAAGAASLAVFAAEWGRFRDAVDHLIEGESSEPDRRSAGRRVSGALGAGAARPAGRKPAGAAGRDQRAHRRRPS